MFAIAGTVQRRDKMFIFGSDVDDRAKMFIFGRDVDAEIDQSDRSSGGADEASSARVFSRDGAQAAVVTK